MQKYVSIDDIPEIIRRADAHQVLLVTGSQSFVDSGARDHIERVLRGVDYTRFFDIKKNPTRDDVQRGLEAVAKKSFDFVIAVGGGSVMDVAKSINALEGRGSTRIDEFITGERRIIGVHAPMLAIPTTFGTGSESTHFAVVYIGDKKYSLASEHILPEYVVLEPSLGLSAARPIIASVGLDALCQAIESFWARCSTSQSRNYALTAISRIYPVLSRAVTGDDIGAMRMMADGANLAGRAINISKTTAPHALSYGLSKKFGVPHGFAVASTMPYFLRQNYLQADTESLRSRMNVLYEVLDVSEPDQAAIKFRDLISNLGIGQFLKEFCPVSESDIQLLAKEVNMQRLQNHPLALENLDLVAALRDTYSISWAA